MKTLKTFDNYIVANICLDKLKNENIRCALLDEYTNTINPILGNVIGGIKLVVLEDDVQIATVLLKQFEDEYMKAATCPQCGKNEIISVTTNSPVDILTKLFSWFFASYAVSAESIYQCQSCGYESKLMPIGEDVN